MTSVLWFRRDLRLGDNPALPAAGDGADGGVLPLFVLDEARRPGGAPRLAFLYRSLRALDGALGGRLVVLRGRPERVVPRVARRSRAGTLADGGALDRRTRRSGTAGRAGLPGAALARYERVRRR